MPRFYFVGETHTLASALRPSLEALCASTSEFASCTTPHPLDTFLEVDAPSEAVVRLALLDVKRKIQQARVDVQCRGERAPRHSDSRS
jgi:DNA-directed RNA polymerase subunit L